MNQWEKLVELHRIFQNNRSYISFDEMKNQLRCSRATLFRLLDRLENVLHAPLERSKKYHGYKYNLNSGEKFELPGLWFNSKELEALLCLEASLKGMQQGFLAEILRPLETKFEPVLKAQGIKLEVWKERFKIIPICSRKIKQGIFEIISEALIHQKRLSITYRNLGKGEPQTRIVSPQTILRYRDNWYFDAWCHQAEDLRTFSISRIMDGKKLKQKAILIPRTKLEEHYTGSYGIFSGKPTNIAVIKFTGTAAKEVSQEEWHPKQVGILNDSGEYVLKVPYNNSTELVMDILRWSNEAEIISPPNLRKDIALQLLQASQKYL